jgi:hypothetical protein
MLCTDIAMGLPLHENKHPSDGDVLITTEPGGVHLLSVVPHPHRVSFTDLSQALEIGAQWAKATRADVWRTVDGNTVRMTRS